MPPSMAGGTPATTGRGAGGCRIKVNQGSSSLLKVELVKVGGLGEGGFRGISEIFQEFRGFAKTREDMCGKFEELGGGLYFLQVYQ